MFKKLLILLLVVPTLANAGSEEGAKQYTTDVLAEVKSVLDSTQSDDEKLAQLITYFDANIHTSWMGQYVLGKYRSNFSDEQKKQYLALYHDYLLYSYVPKFTLYDGQNIDITSAKDLGKGKYVVNAEVSDADSKDSIGLSIRLVSAGDKYKIIDIIAEGVSLLSTQKDDFDAILSRYDADKFIAMIGKKVKRLTK